MESILRQQSHWLPLLLKNRHPLLLSFSVELPGHALRPFRLPIELGIGISLPFFRLSLRL